MVNPGQAAVRRVNLLLGRRRRHAHDGIKVFGHAPHSLVQSIATIIGRLDSARELVNLPSAEAAEEWAEGE